jgi:hypothetical protein
VTTPSHVLATWSRYLGALALLGVGLDHLEQFSVDSYSVIPTIGTLFALNCASAALLAAGLVAPVQRLPGYAGRLAVPLLGIAGIGVAAGSLAGLLLSESTGLFGFTETGYRPAILLSIGLEAATIALLGVHLALRRRPHRAPRSAARATIGGAVERQAAASD